MQYNDQKQNLKISQEDWMVKKWRPMMGWTYMATCIFDFIIGPVFFNLLQYYNTGQAISAWTPLTLQGGGLYHLAMGAVLGISAWSRGQEKLNGSTNVDTDTPSMLMEQTDSSFINTSDRPKRKAPNL